MFFVKDGFNRHTCEHTATVRPALNVYKYELV